MSLRTLCTSAIVLSGFVLIAPTATNASALAHEKANPCTWCGINPYTGGIYCVSGATIGDTGCQCWTNTCALV
jgi:hypothetical protein